MLANLTADHKPDLTPPRPVLPAGWPKEIDRAAFQGLAGRFVEAIEPHSEADPVALLVQIITAFGNCIGRTAHFRVESDHHFCNLYAVLVGDTGKGRKGTSLGHVRNVIGQADPEWAAHCVKTGLSTGEGLLHAVRDRRSQDGEDAGGADDKRLLAIEPEFATLLRHMERQGNILSSQLRQCWDSPSVCATLTRTNPIRATGTHVSVIGHVTADELRRYLTQTEMANGLGNRFVWFAVRRSKCLPEGGCPDPQTLDALSKDFANAVTVARGRQDIRFTDKARSHWRDVYEDLSEGRPGLSGAMTGRAEAQVRRLATVYALLDQSRECRIQHLNAALALWRYAWQTVYFVFGDGTGDRDADVILDGLRARPKDGLSRTEISCTLFRGNRTAAQIDRAREVLVAARLATFTTIKTGGRDEERWFSQPTKETK